MKSLNFELPEYKKIEINGIMFDILMSDIDIIKKAGQIKNICSELKKDDNGNLGKDNSLEPDKIRDAVLSITGFIDEILGKGAVKKIFKNRPVGVALALDVMTEICKAVVEEYQEGILEKYGDGEDNV